MGLVYMKQAQRAFTIIELVITVTILAILVATAIPSFRTLMANSRSTNLASEMFMALNIARSEAIKRSARISVCASADGATCAGTPWDQGWIVFIDGAATDTAAPVINVNGVIKLWGANSAGANVAVTQNNVPLTFVRFTAQGMLARAPNVTNTVIVAVTQTGCQGNSGRQLEVGIAGRVSQTSVACP
jgi:type IV fimbrial biogenesis protein FimT